MYNLFQYIAGMILFSIVLLIGITSALECPSNSIGRIADPSECSRYILCDGGSPQTMYCNRGQEFNQKLQICQTPLIPGCLNLFLNLFDDISSTPFCPPNQNVTINLPHENICTKFYSCYMGVLTVFDCAGGTEFYPEKGECDWVSENGCSLRTTTKVLTTEDVTDSSTLIETTERTTTERTITEEISIETSTQEESTTEAEQTSSIDYSTESQISTTRRPICSGISVGVEPHESDCTKYYFCLSGIPQMYQCPDGQEFDLDAKGCIDITGDGCSPLSPTTEEPETTTMEYTTQPQSTTTKKPICSGIQVGLVPHETDCNKFYFCINSIPQMYECPEGQEFNMEARGCVNITGSGCTTTIAPTTEEPTTITEVSTEPIETTTVKLPCSDGALLEPHPTICTKYYFCLSGFPQELDCPDGQEFDAIALTCVDITGDGCSSNSWIEFF